jgi:hypothetical protein
VIPIELVLKANNVSSLPLNTFKAIRIASGMIEIQNVNDSDPPQPPTKYKNENLGKPLGSISSPY